MTDLNKLCIEIDQFGGNVWRFFTPVDTGWEPVMLRGITITDREFVEVLKRFPDLPQEQDVVEELARRGIWQDDQEQTPEQPSTVDTPQPENVTETPVSAISDKDRRMRNKALDAVARSEARWDRRRRR